ncbi:MAG: response regulator [Phycisphaerales bacterium]|jgi:two-component system chemotaxis response regulator CheY|nr:response regulator [Phycisphaerales bacterium]
MRVLIVDDSELVRKHVRKLLQDSFGAEVDDAANGQEGIRKAVLGQPDVIIVDQEMPGMMGVDFIKTYRNLKGRSWVIMHTSMADKTTVLEAVRAGCNDFCVKPLTAQGLGAKLATWSQKRVA